MPRYGVAVEECVQVMYVIEADSHEQAEAAVLALDPNGERMELDHDIMTSHDVVLYTVEDA